MNGKPRSLKRTISAIGLTLLASLAIGAISVASASASTKPWYTCKNVGEGKGTYGDAFCGKKVSPFSYNLSKLPEGSPTGLTMNGTTSFALSWTWSGIPFAFSCSSQTGGGTIENPKSATGVGKATINSFVLSGCTTSGLPGCKVKGGKISFFGSNGLAAEFESKPAVEFTNGSATVTEFVLEGCTSGSLNHSYKLIGSFTGIMNNATSSLEFTKTSSAISMAGNKVTFEGTSKIETTAGETLQLVL